MYQMTIQQILDELSIPYREAGQHRHVSSEWIGIDCPRCSPGSGKFKAGISIEGLHTNCWTCGGLWLPQILVDSSGESWGTVRSLLDGVKSSTGARSGASKLLGPIIYPPGLEAPERPHRAYLKDRGFDPKEIVRLWGIQGIGQAPQLGWSIWIPIQNPAGTTVSWTTRRIGSGEPRYVNARSDQEQIPMSELLYGENLVTSGSIVVVEGPTDVWRLGPGAVAVMGVGISQEQRRRLASFPHRVICFDNDRAGMMKAKTLASELSVFPGTTEVIELETGSDVADADRSEVDEIRNLFL